MSDRVVVLAPATAAARGAQDVLRDWSALGWIEPFCWLEPGHDERLVVDVVADGRAVAKPLMEVLADIPDLDQVRLVVLSCLGERDGGQVPPEAAEQVRARLFGGRADVTATHCVTGRHGRGGWDPGIAWPGWQCVVLAPEESYSPEHNAAPLWPEPGRAVTPQDEVLYHGHVASGLAALTGLWRGATGEPPALRTGVGGAQDVVVARSFVRRLDAGDAAMEVRSRLMDLTLGVPRPHSGRQVYEHVKDPTAAVTRMVDQLAAKHPDLLNPTLPERPPRKKVALSGWQLFKDFLRFVWDLLLGLPDRFRRQVLDAASRRTAAAIEQLAFGGAETSYVVEVAGQTADGHRITDLDRLATSSGLLARGVTERMRLPAYRGAEYTETGRLWRDVVPLALSLVDGADRGIVDIDLPREGPTGAVLPRPSLVAPGPEDRQEIDPAVSAAIGVAPVRAADVAEQRRVEVLLHQLARDRSITIGNKVDRSLQSLRQWTGRLNGVFLYRLGTLIHDGVERSMRQVNAVAEEIRALLAADGSVPTDQVARASRMIRAILAVSMIGAMLTLAFGVAHRISWTVALLLAPVWLVLGLGGCFLKYVRARRADFAAYYRRIDAQDRLQELAEDLQYAAMDLQRLVVMYRQYLCWSDALGSFLAHPYGRDRRRARADREVVGPLPRSVRIGRVEPDEARVTEACRSLQGQVHRVDWLTALWGKAVASGLAETARTLNVHEVPDEQLWADLAVPGDSPLAVLAAGWAADGVDPAAAEETWQQVVSMLGRPGTTIPSELGEVVDLGWPAGGDGHVTSGFVDSLREQAARPGYLDPTLFTGSARNDDLHRVAGWAALPPEGGSTSASLDRVQVVVQYTQSVDAELLTLAGTGAAPPTASTDPPVRATGTVIDLDGAGPITPNGTQPEHVDLDRPSVHQWESQPDV